MPSGRRQLLALATILGIGVVLLNHWLDTPPRLEFNRFIAQGSVSHPSHVIAFGSDLVFTEVHSGRLGRIEPAGRLNFFDPTEQGERLYSPHFLERSPSGTLLVSEGWGSGIVAMDDASGSRWQRYRGPEEDRLKSPHGVCVGDDGRIYVGDSRNSRIVRFQDLSGRGFEVFTDHARIVAYARQLLCRNGRVWIANSYEDRPGLNAGVGGNILRIDEWDSGTARVVVSFPQSTTTGLALIDQQWLLVGLWRARNRMALVDLDSGEITGVPAPATGLGPPYGMYLNNDGGRLLVAFLGDVERQRTPGAIAEYRVRRSEGLISLLNAVGIMDLLDRR